MLSVFDVWIVHLPAGRQSRPRDRLRCHCRGGDGQVRSKLCHWSCWLGKVPRLRTDFVKMFLTPAFQMQLSSQILCLTTIYVSLASMARRLERLHLSNHLCLSQHCPAFSWWGWESSSDGPCSWWDRSWGPYRSSPTTSWCHFWTAGYPYGGVSYSILGPNLPFLLLALLALMLLLTQVMVMWWQLHRPQSLF